MLINTIKKVIYNITAPIDTEAGSLSNIPDRVIRLSAFMSANAILQAIGDIFLEGAILLEFVSFKIPLRVEFLFLTLISTVIAFLTLDGMRNGDLDVTKNTLLIGLLVESALVVGDLYLLVYTSKDFLTTALVRSPFIFFTSCNIAIITYIITRSIQIKAARPNYRF